MIALLDTSTSECRLTLVQAHEQHYYTWQADRELAKGLLGFIRDNLAKHSKQISELTGIGVMQGPGSFTGLRIGMTVMNTLADSLDIPIVGSTGTDWQAEAITRLSRGENDRLILPEYGANANITKPRK